MIKVKKLLKSNFAAWDTFVLRANNGTIFHLRDFLNYHPKNRFKDFSLEFHKNNNLLSVIPAAVVLKNNKKLFVSHPGASFASFVTKEDFSIKDSFEVVEKLIKYTKSEGFDGVQLKTPPAFYSKRISNYIEYALLSSGFNYLNREVTSTLFIEKNENAILKKFKSSHSRAVRKSQNLGVEIKITDQVDEFFLMLEKNLKIRQGAVVHD